MAAQAVRRDQKAVVLLFVSPGPVMSERDSMVEQAAKVVPGLGFMIKASQDHRDLEASKDLQRYLPAWQPAALLYPALMDALAKTGHALRLLPPDQAGLSQEALRRLNLAADVGEWQLRYFVRTADKAAPIAYRDYASLPELKDALVLEVNLAYGAPSNGEGKWVPTLASVTKLYRAEDMKVLWRHEDAVEDRTGLKTFAAFKNDPSSLLAAYERLMPALSQSLSAGLSKSLQEAGFAP